MTCNVRCDDWKSPGGAKTDIEDGRDDFIRDGVYGSIPVCDSRDLDVDAD